MGKNRIKYSADKAMNVIILYEATLSRKEQIVRTDTHNSIMDEYAHKKPEISLPKRYLKDIWNAYTYGYFNWDKMSKVEKGLYLGFVGINVFGIAMAVDYVTKGFISDNVKKGGKFIKEKAGEAYKEIGKKTGGAAFYELLKDGSKLNVFFNMPSYEKTKNKEVLTEDDGDNIGSDLYGNYYLGEPKELFEYNSNELKAVTVVHTKIPSLKKIESDYGKIIYGEKVSFEELYKEMNKSDAIVFGEVHYFNPERYKAVVELISVAKDGTKPTIIGLEGFKKDVLVKSSRLQHFTDINSLGIPVVGIENIETDELGRIPETGKAEKERFAYIVSWTLNKTENGKKPIDYVGDAHTTGVVESFKEDSWKSDTPYNIRDALVKKGFKPLIIHIRDKPVMGQTIDQKFAADYKKIPPYHRKKFLEEANNLWSSIVKPWEDDDYFIKASNNEYYFIISDHNLPYSTPKSSVWVNGQQKT